MSSILIEGIGGIGGVLAAKMIEAGYAPVLLTHNPAITEAIQRWKMCRWVILRPPIC
jgi:ketopantoate reductase